MLVGNSRPTDPPRAARRDSFGSETPSDRPTWLRPGTQSLLSTSHPQQRPRETTHHRPRVRDYVQSWTGNGRHKDHVLLNVRNKYTKVASRMCVHRFNTHYFRTLDGGIAVSCVRWWQCAAREALFPTLECQPQQRPASQPCPALARSTLAPPSGFLPTSARTHAARLSAPRRVSSRCARRAQVDVRACRGRGG